MEAVTTMTTVSTQLALFEPSTRLAPTGFVYFGTDGANIKIGYSASPRRRGGELKVTMLWTFPGTVDDEREHQRRWFRHRIAGSEWFRPGGDLLEWLDDRVLPCTSARFALRSLIFRRRVADPP